MDERVYRRNVGISLVLWLALGAAAVNADWLYPGRFSFSSGVTLLQVVGMVAGILASSRLLKLISHWVLTRCHRPSVEGMMIGRIYDLLAALAIVLTFAYGLGKLGAFGAVFAAFGGMLLGWSLQAPVSGFAAWILVSLKRPFRPGDRVQFPNLNLTGDVQDIGIMYTVLNQVGGTIGSEEAVGRYILVPNAMLFSQVVINYTVAQDSPYMLDECVIRITYDSDWQESERILIDAAEEVTRDVIAATGVHPYVRSDLYDYGVYLRLRYQTRVKDRAEISYLIQKKIFAGVQRTPSVDMAIPFVYSYRAAQERRDEDMVGGKSGQTSHTLELARIRAAPSNASPGDIAQVMASIKSMGLLQPIVVKESAQSGFYDVLAGHVRFEACKQLGWKTVPVVVQDGAAASPSRDPTPPRAERQF